MNRFFFRASGVERFCTLGALSPRRRVGNIKLAPVRDLQTTGGRSDDVHPRAMGTLDLLDRVQLSSVGGNIQGLRDDGP